jgi:hypothetical protein
MTICGRGSNVTCLQNDAVGAQRAGDILQILLTHIGDGDFELAQMMCMADFP